MISSANRTRNCLCTTVAARIVCVLLTTVGGVLRCRGVETETVAEPPPANVLLIISDDQAWSDYGFMGHPHIRTPHLDRLAAESLVFTRGYVTAPLCRPSLASIMTGLYPRQHGITGNDPVFTARPGEPRYRSAAYLRGNEQMIRRFERCDTIPQLLSGRGYLSLQTGKWWEGDWQRGGFTHGMTHGDPERGGRHGDEGLKIGRATMQPVADFLDEAQREGRPFFLWYGVFLPHAPHDAPERFRQHYLNVAPTAAVARYWANCEWFDATCGDLLALLDASQFSSNTLVVFVCDNGWIQDPDHPNACAPRSKRSPYEAGIRTPVMLRWPGRIVPRRDDATLVSSIDLAPTILAACGVPHPAEMRGVNLLAQDTSSLRQRTIFAEAYDHDTDVADPFTRLEFLVAIEGHLKCVLPAKGRSTKLQPELYDLHQDPFEQKNLAAERPAQVEQFQQKIRSWWSNRP